MKNQIITYSYNLTKQRKPNTRMKNKTTKPTENDNTQLQELTKRITKLEIAIETATRKRERLSHTQDTNETRHKDREGTVIHVGDNVAFLTKGRFNSTEGIVTSVSGVKRITAKDSSRAN